MDSLVESRLPARAINPIPSLCLRPRQHGFMASTPRGERLACVAHYRQDGKAVDIAYLGVEYRPPGRETM